MSLTITVAVLFYFLSEGKDPGRCFSNSTEAAGILYIVASAGLSLVFSMLLSDDKEYGFFPIFVNYSHLKGVSFSFHRTMTRWGYYCYRIAIPVRGSSTSVIDSSCR